MAVVPHGGRGSSLQPSPWLISPGGDAILVSALAGLICSIWDRSRGPEESLTGSPARYLLGEPHRSLTRDLSGGAAVGAFLGGGFYKLYTFFEEPNTVNAIFSAALLGAGAYGLLSGGYPFKPHISVTTVRYKQFALQGPVHPWEPFDCDAFFSSSVMDDMRSGKVAWNLVFRSPHGLEEYKRIAREIVTARILRFEYTPGGTDYPVPRFQAALRDCVFPKTLYSLILDGRGIPEPLNVDTSVTLPEEVCCPVSFSRVHFFGNLVWQTEGVLVFNDCLFEEDVPEPNCRYVIEGSSLPPKSWVRYREGTTASV